MCVNTSAVAVDAASLSRIGCGWDGRRAAGTTALVVCGTVIDLVQFVAGCRRWGTKSSTAGRLGDRAPPCRPTPKGNGRRRFAPRRTGGRLLADHGGRRCATSLLLGGGSSTTKRASGGTLGGLVKVVDDAGTVLLKSSDVARGNLEVATLVLMSVSSALLAVSSAESSAFVETIPD